MNALERLKAGNRRFVDGDRSSANDLGPDRRRELAGAQTPFAIVLTCADSRVAPEHVFDQGLGELFVLRVAGNIATTVVIGSIEMAVKTGASLIVVMGHSNCAAVGVTLDAVKGGEDLDSPHLAAIVEHVRPAVEASMSDLPGAEDAAVLDRAIALNVHSSVACLKQDSELLRGLLDDGALQVVGAEYSLQTGAVEFFDEGADS